MEEKCIELVKIFKEGNKTIAFMESCTGGYLANQITNISGASDVLKVSAVTYSNEYKIKFGVSKNIIEKFTVYSQETAIEMAKKYSTEKSYSFVNGMLKSLTEGINVI